MGDFRIKKGLDLRIKGKAKRSYFSIPKPLSVALLPKDYNSVKPKLLLGEGSEVKGGEAVFMNKNDRSVRFVSPVPGKISEIRYGARRSIESIVITPDWDGAYVDHPPQTGPSISKMSREAAVSYLKESGWFPFLRQRPFDKIPSTDRYPKSIFINGMNSAPNSGDLGYMVKDHREDLALGIAMLGKLTDGKVYLCYGGLETDEVYKGLSGVEHHRFLGPHPSGLVGTHIHFIDPIRKGDIVWYCDVTHVASLGSLLKKGRYNPEKVLCLSGSGVQSSGYVKTFQGADVKTILGKGLMPGEQRLISGTILYGNRISEDGHIGFYESNLQVIPEGRRRHFMGWAMPGFRSYSASSRAFVSSLFFGKEWNFDTNRKGGCRSIVWTDVYDQVMPLDILTNFLVKAVLSEDIERIEELGIYEVSDEDFALATYLCPSKTDISSIIRRGLDTLEKEGY